LAGPNILLSAVMSGGSQKRRFLSPNRISELVWDSESDETSKHQHPTIGWPVSVLDNDAAKMSRVNCEWCEEKSC